MVIRELLEETSYNLAAVDNHIFEAHLIVRTVLGLAPMDLVLSHKDEVTQEQVLLVREMVLRRLSGEPLQYILGTQEFMGLSFLVDKSVLIPRADTETLVEAVLSHIGKSGASVLDIGCGSGCIGLSLAYFNQRIYARGVDISTAAIETAEKNALQLKLSDRVAFTNIDILNDCPLGKYDVLVSNPPYIPTQDIAGLMREVRDFEPKNALDGGSDGLIFYRRIAEIAPRLLNENGFIAFEVGYDQAHLVSALLQKDFTDIKIIKDLCGIERVVTAKRAPTRNELCDKTCIRFDFGNGCEHDGYIKIRPDTLFDQGKDYGIEKTATAYDRPKGDYWQSDIPHLRDMLDFSDNSFTVCLENGSYTVRIFSGDYLGEGDFVTKFDVNGSSGSIASRDGCVLSCVTTAEVCDNRLVVRFDKGEHAYLNAIEISPTPQLSKPQLTAVSTAQAVTIEWQAIDGACNYIVRRYDSFGTSQETIVQKNIFTDSTVKVCGEYTYSVVPRFGCDFEGEGGEISVIAADYSEPLDTAPTLTLYESERAVDIKWTSVLNALQYEIFRSAPKGAPQLIARADGLSYTDKIDTNVSYTYGVRAITPNGRSPMGIEQSKVVHPPYQRRDATSCDIQVRTVTECGICYLDAYRNRERLWRISLGINIRPQSVRALISDLDGDGVPELVLKTADGTIDGCGKIIGDRFADYRTESGYILEGPEYLTLFDGNTGAALDSVSYFPPRGNVRRWGDSRGIGAERCFAICAYLGDKNPSLVTLRCGRELLAVVSYDVVNKKLKKRWQYFDAANAGDFYPSAEDINGDGRDEIICGDILLDFDGNIIF